MKHFYYVTLVGTMAGNEFQKDFNTTAEATKFAKKFNVAVTAIIPKEAYSSLGKIAKSW